MPLENQLILFVWLGSLSIGALADIYTWVDKAGNVHFGDQPPEEVQSERIRIETSTDPGRAESIELQRRRLEQSSKEADQRIEARNARAAAGHAELEGRQAHNPRCLVERKQLAVLEELHLPAYRDENGRFRAQWKHDTYQGEREYLDDAARKSEIHRARQRVANSCRTPDDENAQRSARFLWIMSERCAAARALLEHVEQPRARSPRQEIESKRREVEMYCSKQSDAAGRHLDPGKQKRQ